MRSIHKVLMLVENTAYPFDVRVRHEAHALRDAGYKVAVISPRRKEQPFHECISDISVYRFPFPPQGKGLLGYIYEFFYATAAMLLFSFWAWWSHGFDVIHAANPPDTIFVIGIFYKIFGKRFVFDHHDLSPETYLSRFQLASPNLVYRILLFLEKWSYRTADLSIATNESYREIALTRGGKKPENVYIVRNGPLLSLCPGEVDPKLAQRAEYIIGYIGTMGPQDGVDYWLKALHEIVYTFNRRNLLSVIIGGGDAVPGLCQLREELNIEPYVWFTGRLRDDLVVRYLSTAQICVHPDPLNPLNNVSTMNKMMEYMALGKPVVSFDLVEARFSARSAALYAKPNDILDYARKVISLMDDKEARERMGQIGQERVRNLLAWEYSAPHLLEAYHSLSTQT